MLKCTRPQRFFRVIVEGGVFFTKTLVTVNVHHDQPSVGVSTVGSEPTHTYRHAHIIYILRYTRSYMVKEHGNRTSSKKNIGILKARRLGHCFVDERCNTEQHRKLHASAEPTTVGIELVRVTNISRNDSIASVKLSPTRPHRLTLPQALAPGA